MYSTLATSAGGLFFSTSLLRKIDVTLRKKAKGEVYGFLEKIKSESECVAELMKMCQQMTEKE